MESGRVTAYRALRRRWGPTIGEGAAGSGGRRRHLRATAATGRCLRQQLILTRTRPVLLVGTPEIRPHCSGQQRTGQGSDARRRLSPKRQLKYTDVCSADIAEAATLPRRTRCPAQRHKYYKCPGLELSLEQLESDSRYSSCQFGSGGSAQPSASAGQPCSS
jgi:hypothetical protein